jgi:uncharacterized damage-inducible protein DinB
MKEYLLNTFRFNSTVNLKMLVKIKTLPDQQECIRYFSHLINSQNKWLQRILVFPNDPQMDWWKPEYKLEDLEEEWLGSVNAWLDFIKNKTEEQLKQEVKFKGYDGGTWACALEDIILQLNYHSIHHRAQMQLFIRKQGIEPDFIDYIGTKYRKIS